MGPKKRQVLLLHHFPQSSKPMPDQPLWNRPMNYLPRLSSSNSSSSRLSNRAQLWRRRQHQAAFNKLRSSSLPQLFRKFSRPLSSSPLLCSTIPLRSLLRSNKMQFSRAQPCIPHLVSKSPLFAQLNNQSSNLHLSNRRWCNHLSSKHPTNSLRAHRVSPNSSLSHSLLSSNSHQCSSHQCSSHPCSSHQYSRLRCSRQVSSQSSSNPASSSQSSSQGSREVETPPEHRIVTPLSSPEASSTSLRVSLVEVDTSQEAANSAKQQLPRVPEQLFVAWTLLLRRLPLNRGSRKTPMVEAPPMLQR